MDNHCLETVTKTLVAEDFCTTRGRAVYEAMLGLSVAGQGIDQLTVIQEMTRAKTLHKAGGAAGVCALTDGVLFTGSVANVEQYVAKVKEMSQRRRIAALAEKMRLKAGDQSISEDELLDFAERELFAIADRRAVSPYEHVYHLMPEAVEYLERLYNAKGDVPGIPSGYAKLDEITGGFQDDDLVIIGARPSLGKSSISLSMATNMAIRFGAIVGLFSLETSRKQLMLRLISGEGRVDAQQIRLGAIGKADFGRITDVGNKLAGVNMYVNDTPNIRLVDLRAQARRMRQAEGVQIIFVDYIGLITHERQDLKRHEQVSDISRSLKALARELGIPIVAVSQLRRETEGRRPMLSDLRESGSLEQDADVVIFLHRPRTDEGREMVTEVIVAKQRNGPTGTVELVFLPRYTRFESMERRHD